MDQGSSIRDRSSTVRSAVTHDPDSFLLRPSRLPEGALETVQNRLQQVGAEGAFSVLMNTSAATPGATAILRAASSSTGKLTLARK